MSLEFQDGAGNTFCCEGEGAPSDPNDPNIDWSTACNGGPPHAGGCTIASVGFPGINTSSSDRAAFYAIYGRKYPNLLHQKRMTGKVIDCRCK